MRSTARIFAALVFPLVALAASPWPEVQSDLPADPALKSGTLANGLRYLILPNAEPMNRISLRLLVAVGSLHEADHELGLAHFVEHMAFRGTRTHPTGSLTTALQRLGVGLGPDAAAFTTYEHTIYHLELPDAGEATLREGLRVFREYAQEVTFDAKLIERERGVVLSEMATRDTPDARAGRSNLAFLFPEARQTRRPVIGTEALLRGFTRAQFVSFYDAWYRPERMAVIVVGNVEPAAVERLLAEELGKLKPRGPARADLSDLGVVVPGRPDIAVYAEPTLVGVTLTIEHPDYVRRAADTHERRVQWLQEAMAFAMFQERLKKIARQPEASFVAAAATSTWPIPNWRVASLSVTGKINDWTRVLTEVEQEHRRAIQFGFTTGELALARASFATSIEESVRTAPTRPSSGLADQLAANLEAGTVFSTPAQMQEDLKAALESTTMAACLAAFRTAWSVTSLHVFIAANTAFNILRTQVAATLNQSRETPVAPPTNADAPVVFGYQNFGPPGTLVRDEHLADLDVRLAEFANGVRCNFKSTPFEADVVQVNVRVGEGKLVQPKNQPGIDYLADAAFLPGGLTKHTAQELHEFFAGHAVNYSFQVQSDACVFSARCARRELPLCLQVIAAYLRAPAFRPEAMREANAQFGSMYSSLLASPGGPINFRSFRDLLGGDNRFGLPLAEELSERNHQELFEWLQPQLESGAIELSVVGDLPWDEAAAAVARTLGALPKRDPRRDTPQAAALTFAAPPGAPVQIASDAKFKQSAIACYWPVTSLEDIREERRCHVLAAILADRIRIRLREELGTAYSPTVNFVYVDGFPGVKYFALYAEVETARSATAQKIIEREAASLSTKGPTADEFVRAKQPYLHMMSDSRRTNDYWCRTVLSDAQLRPARIEAARNRIADLDALSHAEVVKLARQYLAPKSAFTFVTIPGLPTPLVPAKSPPE